MPFTQGQFEYDESNVRTIANTNATIPAGRHSTIEDDLKIRIIAGNREIDVSPKTFEKLKREGRVRD